MTTNELYGSICITPRQKEWLQYTSTRAGHYHANESNQGPWTTVHELVSKVEGNCLMRFNADDAEALARYVAVHMSVASKYEKRRFEKAARNLVGKMLSSELDHARLSTLLDSIDNRYSDNGRIRAVVNRFRRHFDLGPAIEATRTGGNLSPAAAKSMAESAGLGVKRLTAAAPISLTCDESCYGPHGDCEFEGCRCCAHFPEDHSEEARLTADDVRETIDDAIAKVDRLNDVELTGLKVAMTRAVEQLELTRDGRHATHPSSVPARRVGFESALNELRVLEGMATALLRSITEGREAMEDGFEGRGIFRHQPIDKLTSS